jgi:hypothetical protein
MRKVLFAALVAIGSARLGIGAAPFQASGTWRFVVSGDSRNCGDVVMPAIAETATASQAAFFWHLGDLRATTNFDNDMMNQPEHLAAPMTMARYLEASWPDFIENQIRPFGQMPFLVGIGNHDVAMPRTRDAFVKQFAQWLDQPWLHDQRLADNARDTRVKPYYHWILKGVAFLFLDNASLEQIDPTQLSWFDRVMTHDAADPSITTIVVGMHKPLPDSFAGMHSMIESPTGIESGRHVMERLQRARTQSHKRVYTLASHQHFYMEDYLSNSYWQSHGGSIPGWIVGTAGAPRYPLPTPVPAVAQTNVYGSLVATVDPSGEIGFEFRRVDEPDIPAAVVARYGREFVHWCIANNSVVR